MASTPLLSETSSDASSGAGVRATGSGAWAADVAGTYSVHPGNSISVIHQQGSLLNIFNSRWGPPTGKIKGNQISANMLLMRLKGKVEDGVITWNTGHVARRIGPAPEDPEEALKQDKKWYPGKKVKARWGNKVDAARRETAAARAAGQYEKPTNRMGLLANWNAMKKKRTLMHRGGDVGMPIGSLTVSVLQGQFSTARPYFILELDENEARTPPVKSTAPVWGSGSLPKAEFTFPVYDPSSDLRLFLYDDEEFSNERAIGRVIVPVRDLCTQALLPRPRDPLQRKFKILPATRQGAKENQVRYREAIPHVPGSGMAKPSRNLGAVELRLELRLSAPGHERFGLLAAYAHADPPFPEEEESEDDEVGQRPSDKSRDGGGKKAEAGPGIFASPNAKLPKASAKVMRGHLLRLSRLVALPFLLRPPTVFLQPVVLYWVCFHAEVYHLPWVAFALIAASGALNFANRREWTKDMIFWEEAVGQDDMPHGLKKLRKLQDGLGSLQHALGVVATLLEKQRNVINFADPPVSLVAFLCLGMASAALSAVLWLVNLRLLLFVVGMLALLPALGKALARERPPTLPQQPPVSPTAAGQAQALLMGRRRGLPRPIRMLLNVLGRVPDGRDIAHHHFCTQQVISSAPLDV